MSVEPISETLLTRLGYAAFEDAGGGELTLLGPAPEWFARAFGEESVRGGRFVPGDSSPFLENFLGEAQQLWDDGQSGADAPHTESGEWIERGADGRDIALEAEALLLEGRRILLVANLQTRYDEKSRMLQLARVDKLAHEKLLREIQTKEILLHCIVHDLAQPLTALKGCLSLLAMNLPPEKVREVVDIAERQARKQEGMIRDVLKTFASDMAAAAGAGANQAVDVAQAAREVVTEYSAAFASQGARLALDSRLGEQSAPADWQATGEPDRLRRMFTNYLENALRYSPAGTVTTVGVEDDHGFLRAFVDDQGPGLPEGVSAATLFRLFGKGKESKGKAGLGLYFCKITAERWGGSVGCDNRAEGGTRFWFRLPRAHRGQQAGAARAGDPAAAARKIPEAQSAGGSNQAAASPASKQALRILLADDVEVNRAIAAQLLESGGHKTVSVDDGAPAVEAFRAEPFDLVLLDVEMPVMGGLEAARAMRQIEKERGTRARILAMTAHATQEDLNRCLAAGMDGRILKPFDVEALFDEIEGRGARPAESPAGRNEPHRTEEASEGASAFREQLLARCSGDAGLAAKIARMFLKDSPRLLDAVRQAAANGDAADLAAAAHALKGAVGHFGAQEAREAARRVEDAARRGELAGLFGMLKTLESSVEALRHELEQLNAGTKLGRRPGK